MHDTAYPPFLPFEHIHQLSLHRSHYSFSLIPSLKPESLPKCCFSYWTVCRIACCQIKLHTALVNLISNLTAQPQSHKMHVRKRGYIVLLWNYTHFKRSTTLQIFIFPFGLEENLISWEGLLLPIEAQTSLGNQHLTGLWNTFYKVCMQENSPRADRYTCVSNNSTESKLIN